MGASTRAFTLGAKAGRATLKAKRASHKSAKMLKKSEKSVKKSTRATNKMRVASERSPKTVASAAGSAVGFHSNKIAVGSAAGIGAATTTRNKHRRVTQ